MLAQTDANGELEHFRTYASAACPASLVASAAQTGLLPHCAGDCPVPIPATGLKPERPCDPSDIFRWWLCRCRNWRPGGRSVCPVCNAPAICQPFQPGDGLPACARPDPLPRVVGDSGGPVCSFSCRKLAPEQSVKPAKSQIDWGTGGLTTDPSSGATLSFSLHDDIVPAP